MQAPPEEPDSGHGSVWAASYIDIICSHTANAWRSGTREGERNRQRKEEGLESHGNATIREWRN